MTVPQTSLTAHAVSLPSERFYWALIELNEPLSERPWRARWDFSRRREELLYRFEEVIPIPIEEVHAVFLPVDQRRILACGMERDILQRYRLKDILELGPQSVPECLTESGITELKLNLLSGPMTPPALTTSRRRWISAACWWLCVGVLALSLGLMRRASANFVFAKGLSAQAHSLIHDSLVDGRLTVDSGSGSLPPELQLTAELRRLRQTRGQRVAAMPMVADACESLIALLQAWPRMGHLRTEFIGVTPATLSLAGVADDSAAASQWSQAFASIPGWRLEQPEVSGVAGTSVRLALRWTAIPSDSDGQGTNGPASREGGSQ